MNLEKKTEMRLLDRPDRQVIQEGLQHLPEFIEKSFGQEIPDLVLYCETSARPLAYGVKPILEDVAKKRNQEAPLHLFLGGIDRVKSDLDRVAEFYERFPETWAEEYRQHVEADADGKIARAEESLQKDVQKEQELRDYFNRTRNKDFDEMEVINDEDGDYTIGYFRLPDGKRVRADINYYSNEADALAANIPLQRKDLAKYKIKRERIQEQIDHFIALREYWQKKIEAQKAERVLIIDDYAHYGSTLSQTHAILPKEINGKMISYAFYSFVEQREGIVEKQAKKLNWKGAGGMAANQVIRIDDEGESGTFQGFTFAHGFTAPPMWEEPKFKHTKKDLKSKMVGMTKGELGEQHSSRSVDRDPELMKTLRHEVQAIASKVLKGESEDFYTQFTHNGIYMS